MAHGDRDSWDGSHAMEMDEEPLMITEANGSCRRPVDHDKQTRLSQCGQNGIMALTTGYGAWRKGGK